MPCIHDLATLDLIDPNLLGWMALHRDGATVRGKSHALGNATGWKSLFYLESMTIPLEDHQ